MRSAWQESIFSGHPTLPLPLEPAGKVSLRRGIAEHAGPTDLNENRPFRVLCITWRNHNRPQIICGPTISTHRILLGYAKCRRHRGVL
jgi:hypothetical protein